MAYLVLRLKIIPSTEDPKINLYAFMVVGAALALGAAFLRSRLFLAALVIGLSQAAFIWLSPQLPLQSQHILFNAVAVLIPLNLLGLVWLWDRGIISPAGKRRLLFLCLEVLAIIALMLPRFSYIAVYFGWQFVPKRFSDWSSLPQPALAAFMFTAIVLTISLARRYESVASCFLWSLASVFMALHAGGTGSRPAVYFAGAGVTFILAVLETSYRMAYHDELTRLPSRRALNEALLKLGDSYTLAMVDVDHFKKFNDTYGHEAGDQALQMVASKLARVTGGGKAYRYGGEEFAVLFPDRPVEEAFTYLDRLRNLIEHSSFVVRGSDRRRSGPKKKKSRVKTETTVTVSVGIAANQRREFAVDEVLRAADQALYKAKARGRNCAVIGKPAKSTKPIDLKTKILQMS